jgi:ribonuclease HI
VDDDADDETVREQTFSSAKRSLNFSNHGSNSMINPYAKRIVSDPVGMTPPRAFSEALCTDTVSPSAKRSLDFTNYGRVDNPYKRSASGSSSSMSSQNRRDAGTENSGTIDSDKTYTLYFDGGSRGNPGMAGAGMTIYDESLGTEVWSGHEYLGSNKTNNEAEYAALSTGLLCAKALGVQRIHVKGDSQLVIKQIRGEYRVNSPKLLPYYDCVMATIRDSFSLFLYPSHIPRDKNKRADALANKAMDSKTTDLSGLKEEQIITHAETIRVPPSQCTPPQDHPFGDLTDDDLCISVSQSGIKCLNL